MTYSAFLLEMAITATALQILVTGALSVWDPPMPVIIRKPTLRDALERARLRRNCN